MKKWRDFHFPGKGENCLSEFYYVKCVFEFLCNCIVTGWNLPFWELQKHENYDDNNNNNETNRSFKNPYIKRCQARVPEKEKDSDTDNVISYLYTFTKWLFK